MQLMVYEAPSRGSRAKSIPYVMCTCAMARDFEGLRKYEQARSHRAGVERARKGSLRFVVNPRERRARGSYEIPQVYMERSNEHMHTLASIGSDQPTSFTLVTSVLIPL